MAESGVTATGRGFDTLARTLATAAGEIGELNAGLARAAEIIAAEARMRAPRRTGRLSGSVRSSRDVGRSRVTAAAPYAGPIHWGWPARHIRARPFILDAADATERQWENACGDDVQRALNRVRGI